MKLISTIVLLFFTSYKSQGQNISYNDLLYVLNNKIESSDSYLSKKYFSLIENRRDTEYSSINFTWGYNVSYDHKSETFIHKTINLEDNSSFIWCQLSDKSTFESIKTFCKTNGFKLSLTYPDVLGGMNFVYENSTHEIEFTISPLKTWQTVSGSFISLKKLDIDNDNWIIIPRRMIKLVSTGTIKDMDIIMFQKKWTIDSSSSSYKRYKYEGGNGRMSAWFDNNGNIKSIKHVSSGAFLYFKVMTSYNSLGYTLDKEEEEGGLRRETYSNSLGSQIILISDQRDELNHQYSVKVSNNLRNL